jgi:hypothetical protein
MAENCSGQLLLETCVSFGNEMLVNNCIENVNDPTQSFSGGGCRPTRSWVFNELKKYFNYVYVPKTQPNHPEFPTNWDNNFNKSLLNRSVFIASHKKINNKLLSTTLINEQSI